jgi:hypothetical protein
MPTLLAGWQPRRFWCWPAAVAAPRHSVALNCFLFLCLSLYILCFIVWTLWPPGTTPHPLLYYHAPSFCPFFGQAASHLPSSDSPYSVNSRHVATVW